MTTELDETWEREDRTEELAERLGLPVDEFAELFGAGWTEDGAMTPHDWDSDPAGGDDWPVTPWMLSGTPAQLMIRVLEHGVFLARPHGVWTQGVTGLEHEPSEQEYVSRWELSERVPELVAQLLRRRRRSFRYCRYCRVSTPPELRDFEDVCGGCAERWLGVVH